MEDRVLVWALGRDGPLTCGFLEEAGFPSLACRSLEELSAEADRGVGVLVIAGELLASDTLTGLESLLRRQPAWSDVPLVVVAGVEAGAWLRNPFEALGSVSLLHRPVSLDTLASTVRTALRARRRQYQVRDLLKQREESDKRKDEFLAMLAHELRNPLATIRTGLQFLRITPTGQAAERTQAMMERQTRNLTRLVDDLLDVSRITQGKITLQKRTLNLGEIISQAADSIARQAAEKGLQLEVVPPEHPLCVDADPTRLEQMIGNVLANALKFTPAKGVIRLSAVREDNQAVIHVRDTGLGIPRSQLGHVFELFAQTERALDRSSGGLGIGLTVVRSLAQLHGGSAEVHSDGPGTGTEVILRLPARPAPAFPLAQPSADGDRRTSVARRILVIEDNRDAAEALALFLQTAGHEVAVASDGPSGLAAARRQRPHAIICDIGLPGMDGYEVARQLRQDPGFESCVLIAVTGYGDAADRERAAKAGYGHHLTKPADPCEIELLIDAMSTDGKSPAPRRAPREHQSDACH